VICKDKNIAKRVSIDHKVTNPSEEDRIRYPVSYQGAKAAASLKGEWLVS
jgi:hypothetical protein